MNDEQNIKRAREAKAILDSPLWAESWDVYRTKLVDLIDKADSGNVELVMHAKRLLAASKAAQAHMTTILQNGAVSAAQIKLDEQMKQDKRWWQNLTPERSKNG